MLPLRVRLAQMLETASTDPGVIRRLIGLAMVVVIIGGVVASGGFTLNLEIGRDDADVAAGPVVASAPATAAGGGSAGPSTSPADGAAAVPTASGATSGAAPRSGGTTSAAPAGGSSSAGGTAAAAAPTCEGAALGETDNGVTAESIKIALLQVDLAALNAAGFGLSTGEVDYAKILSAWANAFNAEGGVACRQITIQHEKTDLTLDGQLASCKKLTQDDKVFAVLAPGGLVGGAPCITKDNKTPLVTALAAPEYWDREGAPYLWDVLMSQERVQLNHVRWLHEHGHINPKDHHVGVVFANEPYGGPSVEGTMIPELKRLGYEVRVGKLPYDTEQAAAQMAQVVLDFQQAESQNYFPVYSEDDATVGCQDFLTGTYPEKSWDETLCVGTGLLNGAPNGLRPDELQQYLAGNPFAQRADAVYLATNPEGYNNGGEANPEDTLAQQGSNYLIGSLVSLWAQAANRVGPDLTRPAWGAAMEQTGAFDQTVSPVPYSYAAGKWSGPDHIEIVQWHAAAGDGYEERRYRRVSDRIPALA